MTAADYTRIRQRLDQPQVVVHDPCAPTLAPDDPEWPAPRQHLYDCCFAPFPQRTALRFALQVLVPTLPGLELDRPECHGLRTIVELLAAWLVGRDVSPEEMVDALESAGTGLVGWDEPWSDVLAFVSVADVAADVICGVHRPPKASEVQLGADGVVVSLGPVKLDDLADVADTLLPTEVALAHWWARCRALVPIAESETAEIEWGDIGLPPPPADT